MISPQMFPSAFASNTHVLHPNVVIPLHRHIIHPLLTASIVTWTGNGNGVYWSDPNNWSTGKTPSINDTIQIGNNTVNHIVYLNILFVLNGTISIGPGSSLAVNPKANLIIGPIGNVVEYGTLAISKGGTVTNLGSIDPESGSHLIENNGTFTNQGAIISGNPPPVNSNYLINNYGSFTNNGYIVILQSILTNKAGAHLTNNGYIWSGASDIINSGKMSNTGYFVDADMYDYPGSSFNFLQGSLLNNTGNIGVGGSLNISIGSTAFNNGTIETIRGQYGVSACCFVNDGTLYNEIGGSIGLHNTGSVANNGTIINHGSIGRDADGAFPSNWSFANYPNKVIDNFGQITLDSGPFDSSSLYNGGTIKERCNSAIQLLGTTMFSGNPVLYVCGSSRHTATTVTPDPAAAALSSNMTFHVKVVDSSTGNKSNPTGFVSWSDGGDGGKFYSNSLCTLIPVNKSSTCTIAYTSPPTTGPVTITATYAGDNVHKTSSGNSSLTVTLRNTITTVTPNPAAIGHGGKTILNARVFDTSSSTKSNPTGLASWSDGGAGGSFSSPTCTLIPSTTRSIQYISQFGTPGSGNGQFNGPQGIALDSSSNIYVADYYDNRVEKFSSSGTYISQFGTPGSGDGQFNNPLGITLDSSGNIYVADSGNNRIEEFSSSGTYISQFGSAGSGNGQFGNPLGIALDNANNIYVTDYYNNRVEKFSSSGTYISQFGTPGSGDGQFDYPIYITLDSSGNIYVTDNYNNRVEKFDSVSVMSTGPSDCKITYTAPITDGTVTITATYSGDSNHKTSSGNSDLIVS